MKQIHVSVAVILRTTNNGEKQIFATQHGYGEWKNWWKFPGGKIEAGEYTGNTRGTCDRN